MNKEEFERLRPGDIVREKKSGLGYVVMGSLRNGGGVMIVRALHMMSGKDLDYIERDIFPTSRKVRKPRRRIEISED